MHLSVEYCGLIVHKALEGRIREGIQERAVSQELFLKVNSVLSERHKSGYSIRPENEEVPLKRFLKCDQCGEFLRAYKAKKNQKYYYKCNTLGCCCNKRAEVFRTMLDRFVLKAPKEAIHYIIREQMIATYNQLTEEMETTRSNIDAELEKVNQHLERLEKRLMFEEVTREQYLNFDEQWRKQ